MQYIQMDMECQDAFWNLVEKFFEQRAFGGPQKEDEL
jgi:hypothetical protein